MTGGFLSDVISLVLVGVPGASGLSPIELGLVILEGETGGCKVTFGSETRFLGKTVEAFLSASEGLRFLVDDPCALAVPADVVEETVEGFAAALEATD